MRSGEIALNKNNLMKTHIRAFGQSADMLVVLIFLRVRWVLSVININGCGFAAAD